MKILVEKTKKFNIQRKINIIPNCDNFVFESLQISEK